MDQNKRVALLTAIDLGNLTRAAEQLGYTQSGLSYVIKTLETELGFPLLLRSRSGVRPTMGILGGVTGRPARSVPLGSSW